MDKIAVFAGSFCPFTKGHEDIVRKAVPLFDLLYIAIGHNNSKNDCFAPEQRLAWIGKLYENRRNVIVRIYDGLTVDFCRKTGARYLVRGVRNAADYQIEQEMLRVNGQLCPEIETILIPASPQWENASSSLVRELWSLGADYSPFVSYKLPER